jgi:hypothetical protein
MNTMRLWKRVTVAIVASSLLCRLALPVVAAEAAGSLEVRPRWETGETARYEMIKTRRKTQGSQVVLNATTRTDIDMEVLGKDDDGYVVAWTLGATRFDDPQQADNPLVKVMSSLLEGQRIVLELDAEAAIIGVRNWNELKDSSANRMQAIVAELNTAGLDQATIAKLQRQVASMFATKQQVEQMCTREAQMFFMALGIAVAPSEPLEYADSLPNPLGGEPFPSRAQFNLKAVDRASDRATITWTQTVPPDDARRIVEATLRNLATRLGRPVPDEERLRSLSIEDSAEFVLEMSTGWIDRFTHVRTTRTDGDAQEDETMITRKVTEKTE